MAGYYAVNAFMPRMPKDPGDRINYAEKALAGPVSKSAFQHLVGMDPPLLPTGPDVRVVKHMATIGAFMAAGVQLVPAARIANALSREFDDGEPPSGLKEFAEKCATAEDFAALPAEPNDYWYHRLILQAETRKLRKILARAGANGVSVDGAPLLTDDYWEHVARVRAEKQYYYAGLVPAMPADVRIEILDRRYVFMWPTSRLKTFADDRARMREFREKHPYRPGTEPLPEPGFVGWIENWERDTEMSFKHVGEVIQMDPNAEPHRSNIAQLKAHYGEEKYRELFGGDDRDQAWRANAARLQAQAEQEVFPNATGRMVVNVSLAIRRALDRIAEHRWGVLRKREAAKKRPTEAQQ